MTGWLAATGIAIVVLASLYTGLAGSDSPGEALTLPTATPTPVVPDEPAAEEQEQEEATEPEDAAEPEDGAESEGPEIPGERRELTPTPVQPGNRQDCQRIRGTDYHSPEERTWFLSNCVR